jgi:hypothetical protein
MSFTGWVATGILALIAIYIAARLMSAAFFKSKSEYETKRKSNGTQPK